MNSRKSISIILTAAAESFSLNYQHAKLITEHAEEYYLIQLVQCKTDYMQRETPTGTAMHIYIERPVA